MLCTQAYAMPCHAMHTNRAPPPTIPSLQGWHWEVERQFRHRRGTITTLSHLHHNHYQNITTLSHFPSFAFTRHSQKHLNSIGGMRSFPSKKHYPHYVPPWPNWSVPSIVKNSADILSEIFHLVSQYTAKILPTTFWKIQQKYCTRYCTLCLWAQQIAQNIV